MRKILAIFPGKIGDAIYATSSIRLLAQRNPDAEIHWVYGTPGLNQLVNGLLMDSDLPVAKYIPAPCPYNYEGIHGVEWRDRDWDKIMPGYDAYYNLSIGSYPESGCHLVEWIARQAGLIKRGERLPSPFLKLKNEWKRGERTILVHPWVQPVERQCPLLMSLKGQYRGYQVCSIGHKKEPMVPGTIDMRGIPYDQYIAGLRSTSLVVGVASSSAVLGAVLDAPTIMVHNISDPYNAGVSRFGKRFLDLSRPSFYDIEQAINELLDL